jgi:hypothetical protein
MIERPNQEETALLERTKNIHRRGNKYLKDNRNTPPETRMYHQSDFSDHPNWYFQHKVGLELVERAKLSTRLSAIELGLDLGYNDSLRNLLSPVKQLASGKDTLDDLSSDNTNSTDDSK